MTHDDQEWRNRFADITQVPFTDDLKQAILQKAKHVQPTLQPLRRRRDLPRTLMASLAAVSAASVLIWAVWDYQGTGGTQFNPLRSTAHVADSTKSVYGMQKSPLKVENVHTDTTDPHKLVAELTNTGNTVIRPDDVIGLLSFQTKDHPDALVNATWVTVVDPPKQAIDPQETVMWSFNPLGVPTDNNNEFIGKPKLVFLHRGLVDKAQADLTWDSAPLRVEQTHVSTKSTFQTGQSFSVDAVVQNTSTDDLALKDVVAIVWFSAKSDGDWSDPDATSFMYQVGNATTVPSLAPGKTTAVHFGLQGPAKLDVMNTPVHIALIWR